MVNHADTLREALSSGDVEKCRSLWAIVNPHLPQPKTLGDAKIVMHISRTASKSIPLNKRMYSHEWLEERGLHSELPRELHRKVKPPPIIIPGVGISINTSSKIIDFTERCAAIEKAMGDAASECMLNGEQDPEIVSAQMWAARDREIRGS